MSGHGQSGLLLGGEPARHEPAGTADPAPNTLGSRLGSMEQAIGIVGVSRKSVSRRRGDVPSVGELAIGFVVCFPQARGCSGKLPMSTTSTIMFPAGGRRGDVPFPFLGFDIEGAGMFRR